jgi:hypothetical protein
MAASGGQNLVAGKLRGGSGNLPLLLVQVFGSEDFSGVRVSSRKLPPAAATTEEEVEADIGRTLQLSDHSTPAGRAAARAQKPRPSAVPAAFAYNGRYPDRGGPPCLPRF